VQSPLPPDGAPPQLADICDRCGGNLYQRDDDRPKSIKVRLEAYDHSTAPLIDFCTKLGVLLSVPATGSPETICERTVAALTAWRTLPASTV
jgi:adenylate kinase